MILLFFLGGLLLFGSFPIAICCAIIYLTES